jgi:hypothetical protein
MGMKRNVLILLLVLTLGTAAPASATQRLIVRNSGGLLGILNACGQLGCQVEGGLGDPLGQVFLVSTNDNLVTFLLRLVFNTLGITHVEPDQNTQLLSAKAGAVPPSLLDQTLVPYYSSTVWHGYINQPANWIVRTQDTHTTYGVSGSGIVAIIDTGADTTHPVLQPVLIAGYDFTRNRLGADEKGDVTQSSAAVLDSSQQPAYINQSSAAVLDQSSAAVLDNSQYAGYGHGTMTAGVVHLVAPTAKIMPLKAFKVDGSGNLSDVMRAVYYATTHGAKVISMSFSFSAPSVELSTALNVATSKGLICVASAGNDGRSTLVWPAAYSNVMGVASTTNNDTKSTFSNYGTGDVWVAAPGEAIVTTYPGNTYAAAWGTSFSAPFVSGTAALLNDVSSTVNESKAQAAIGNAVWIEADLNKGRLNTLTAVAAWRHALGLQ